MGNQNVKFNMVLSKEVQSNIRFLKSKKIWYVLSTNKKVVSCPDAAANRNRLGHKGIPIFDELKTELGYFINNEKKKQKVLVHCRGNQKVDRLKLSGILNSEYRRLENNGNIKGLVNPVGKQYRNLLQIFDISTLKKFHPPYTMMTNAGHYKYAIEFNPEEIQSSLKNTLVEDVIRKDNYNDFIKHTIGILTGNGPDSGILLWKKINESVKEELIGRLKHSFRGDLSYPEILIESIPEMGISMQLESRLMTTEKTVIKSVISLCNRGATLICIACNTTQFFKTQIEEVCSIYGAKFISIPDVIENYLLKNKVKSFDFIGILYVTDFRKYSAFKTLKDKFSVSIPNKSTLLEINDIAFIAKKEPQNYSKVRPLGDILEKKTTNDIIIIALTEISIILDCHKKLLKSKTAIDSLQVLADNIANLYVEGIFKTIYLDEAKDNFSYHKLGKRINNKIKNQIWKILVEINDEFIPPLSYRDSTTFLFDKEIKGMQVPQKYYQNLLNQEIIICKKKSNNSVIGAISYIPNYKISNGKVDITCYYITTIGVTKGVRGNGITRQFFKMIEQEASKSKSNKIVATRTWSTDKTLLSILKSFGYKKIIEIEDDRGSGIHTVFYSKKIE